MANTATQIFRALITADASGAVKELNRFQGKVQKETVATTKKTEQMGAAFKYAGTLAVAAGGAAAYAFGKQSVDAASSLAESVNAVNKTFEGSAAGILKLGENAVESAGLSERAFNQAAVSMSSFVDQVAGSSSKSAVSVMDDLITRAADFGSVLDLTTEDSLDKFRSGLAGETEPLKRFGINLSAAAVNAYALENGIGEVGRQLTEDEKVLARYGLLMESTEKMAGDWADTNDGLAGSQKTLNASLENFQAKLGEVLIPTVDATVDSLTDMLTLVERLRIVDAINIAVNFDFDGPEPGKSGGGNNPLNFIKGFVSDAQSLPGLFSEAAGRANSLGRDIGEALTEGLAAGTTDVDLDGRQFDWLWRLAEEQYSGSRGLNSMERGFGGVAEAARGLAPSLGDINARFDDTGRKTKTAAQHARDYEKALSDLHDEVYAGIDSMFDYESAVLDLADSVGALADREGNDLRQAQIGAAEDAWRVAQAYADQNAVTGTAAEKTALQLEQLRILKGKYPELATEIDLYIASLNRIPRDINTNVTVNGGTRLATTTGNIRGFNAGLTGGGIIVEEFDTGGVVGGPRGSAQLALVHGGETVLPTHKMSLPGGVGGGRVYNLTLNHYGSGDLAPEAIVDALERYDRRNGTGLAA